MRASFFAATFVLCVSTLACGGGVAVEGASGSGAGAGSGGSSASTSTVTMSSATSSGTTGAGGAMLACAGRTLGPGTHTGMVQSSGMARTYTVHAPPGYVTTEPTPLVLVFHGLTETSASIEMLTEMDPVSDKHGFLAVYPQGLNDSWNAGMCCPTSSLQNVPDVQFVSDLIDQLQAEYCVDAKRVFSTGFSNGGMLSHRLACEMSTRIAAIGAVSGTLAIPSCVPTRPVPVLHVHGMDDPVVAYSNGGLSGGDGVPQTISTWVGIDGCTDATPATVYTMGDATCTEYMACKPGTNVELCVISDGGHQWPGGLPYGIGVLSTNLDASETIASFFDAHPME